MSTAIADSALDQLFHNARTYAHWQPRQVSEHLLKQLYALAKWGPTSANSTPARLVFVQSAEAKTRLLRHLLPGNVEQTRQAPVTAIVAFDTQFPATLPRLYPHADAASWFAGNDALIAETALRNSSLQGAYLILAARALGLDCGPMSGFDRAALDADFFPDGRWQSNFLLNLGYGDASRLWPRSPRLSFDDACKIL